VDQVSRFLMERERAYPSFWPYVILAVVLHGSVVATIFFAARTGSTRPAHLPSVAVMLVRPTRPPARKPASVPAARS